MQTIICVASLEVEISTREMGPSEEHVNLALFDKYAHKRTSKLVLSINQMHSFSSIKT